MYIWEGEAGFAALCLSVCDRCVCVCVCVMYYVKTGATRCVPCDRYETRIIQAWGDSNCVSDGRVVLMDVDAAKRPDRQAPATM